VLLGRAAAVCQRRPRRENVPRPALGACPPGGIALAYSGKQTRCRVRFRGLFVRFAGGLQVNRKTVSKIILATGSARRKRLLRQAHVRFRTVRPKLDESRYQADTPEELVRKLAAAKAEDVRRRLRSPGSKWIFGMDTVIDVDGRTVGKPQDRSQAEAFLRLLAGREHRVLTGVALCSPYCAAPIAEVCASRVRFRRLDLEEISLYLETGEWRGAAGAYRIQERGELLIESIHGSYSNIVGLPLGLFYGMLRRSKYPFHGRMQ